MKNDLQVFLLRGKPWTMRGREGDNLLRGGEAQARVSYEEIYDGMFRGSNMDSYSCIRMAMEHRWAQIEYLLSRNISIVIEEPRISKIVERRIKELCYFYGADLSIVDFPDFASLGAPAMRA